MSFLGGEFYVADESLLNTIDGDAEHPPEMTETEEEKKRPVPNFLRRSMREDNIKFNPPRGGLRRYSKKENIIFTEDKTLLDGSDEIDPETEDTFLLLSKADKRPSRRYSMENNFAIFKEEPVMNAVKRNTASEEEIHGECSVQSSTSNDNNSKNHTKNPFWVVYNIQKFQKNIEHSKLANKNNNPDNYGSNSEKPFDEEKIALWISQKLMKRLSRTDKANEAKNDDMDETKAGLAISHDNLAVDPNIDVICLTQFPDEAYTSIKFNEKLPEIFEGDNNFVLIDGLIEFASSQSAKSSKQFFAFKKISKKTSNTRQCQAALTA